MINGLILKDNSVQIRYLSGASYSAVDYSNDFDAVVLLPIYGYTTPDNLVDKWNKKLIPSGSTIGIMSEGTVDKYKAVRLIYEGTTYYSSYQDYDIASRTYYLGGGAAQDVANISASVVEKPVAFKAGSSGKWVAARVLASSLKVREYPSTSGKIVGSVSKGSTINILMEGNKQSGPELLPSPFDQDKNGPPDHFSKTVWAAVEKPAGWAAVKYNGSLYLDTTGAPQPNNTYKKPTATVGTKPSDKKEPTPGDTLLAKYGLAESNASSIAPIAVGLVLVGALIFAYSSKK
jgi:hypothetical protein